MTPLEAAWQAALAAPEDGATLRVLADALAERGDPHGEFIHLQLAGQFARWSALLQQQAGAFLGDPLRLKDWFPRFERGFLLGASLETASDLDALFSLPLARLLESLKLRHMLDDTVEESVRLLAARAPRTLRLLTLHGPFVPMGPQGVVRVKALTDGLPNLAVLDLGGWQASYAGARSARLQVLTCALQGELESLGEARFPALEGLSLRSSSRREVLPMGLLSGEVAPRLEALTFEGVLWPEQLQDLAVSALLRGLERLDLAVQWGTGWHEVLLEAPDAFLRLERLNLVVAREQQDTAAALQEALPHASVLLR
jgi:hypothetical protein